MSRSVAASLILGLTTALTVALTPLTVAQQPDTATDNVTQAEVSTQSENKQSTTASRSAARPSKGCGIESKPGNNEAAITSAGEERTYRINIPRAYDSNTPMPLVLGFHGRDSDGAEFQNYTGLTSLPAITIFPDGTLVDGKRTWQGAPYSGEADDVLFVSDLLREIQDNYCIDTSRVYATGKSNGGGMVSLLACRLGDRFSAFASVAGAYYPQSFADCDTSTPRSILAIHGTDDATMKYEGGERQGEVYPSAREWLEPWVQAAKCPTPKDKPVGKAGEKVTQTSWSKCANSTSLEFYTVTGGGHVWPGEEMYSGGGYATENFKATTVIWDFFERHPRPWAQKHG